MAGAERVTLASDGTLNLGSKVILGTVDMAAVGARVLLALEPPTGWTVQETPLAVRGLQPPPPSQQRQQPAASTDSESGGGGDIGDVGDTLRPVLAAAGGDLGQHSGAMEVGSSSSGFAMAGGPPAVVLLRNFYAPGREVASAAPEVSLLILNTVVPEEAQAEVAAALLDVVEGRGAGESGGPMETSAASASAAAEAAPGPDGRVLPAVVVVAAALLQQLPQPAVLYEHVLNGAAPLDPGLPPLQPPTAAATHGSPIRLRDGQLAALLHVLQVSGTPACCLVAPGHKPPVSTPLDLPGSLPACDVIGDALAAAFGLQYDAKKCRAIQALYKWFVPGKAAGCDVMYV